MRMWNDDRNLCCKKEGRPGTTFTEHSILMKISRLVEVVYYSLCLLLIRVDANVERWEESLLQKGRKTQKLVESNWIILRDSFEKQNPKVRPIFQRMHLYVHREVLSLRTRNHLILIHVWPVEGDQRPKKFIFLTRIFLPQATREMGDHCIVG